MSYVNINDKRYEIPELTFEAVCELEENGIYLLNMDRNDRKFASMIRALVAWVIGSDLPTASAEIQAHIEKGGNIGDIMTKITEAVNQSSFFNAQRKAAEPETVTEFPQNRAQRRQANRAKNTNHSQRS